MKRLGVVLLVFLLVISGATFKLSSADHAINQVYADEAVKEIVENTSDNNIQEVAQQESLEEEGEQEGQDEEPAEEEEQEGQEEEPAGEEEQEGQEEEPAEEEEQEGQDKDPSDKEEQEGQEEEPAQEEEQENQQEEPIEEEPIAELPPNPDTMPVKIVASIIYDRPYFEGDEFEIDIVQLSSYNGLDLETYNLVLAPNEEQEIDLPWGFYRIDILDIPDKYTYHSINFTCSYEYEFPFTIDCFEVFNDYPEEKVELVFEEQNGYMFIEKEMKDDNSGYDDKEFEFILTDAVGEPIVDSNGDQMIVKVKPGEMDGITVPIGEYKLKEYLDGEAIPNNILAEPKMYMYIGENEQEVDIIEVNQCLVNAEFLVRVVNGIKSTPPPPPTRRAKIKLEKSVYPKEAYPGDEVRYRFKVRNNGDYDLSEVVIEDSLLGELAEFYIGDLENDENKVIDIIYTVPEDSEGEINNTATVQGKYKKSREVTDDDSAVLSVLEIVKIPEPSIELVKYADLKEAFPTEEIEYTFEVTNNGDCRLEKVFVTDPLFGDNWLHQIGFLEALETVKFTHKYKIPQDAKDIVENTAVVTGFSEDKSVSSTSSASVSILKVIDEPDPEPIKTMPDLPHTGGPIEPEIILLGLGSVMILAGKLKR